jgi:hypothetical protein
MHLKAGELKFKKSKTFKAINWLPLYEAFLLIAPPGSAKVASDEEKSAVCALAVSYWQDAFSKVNAGLPKQLQKNLTEEDIGMFSGSQFSVSVGRTPYFKDPIILVQRPQKRHCARSLC